MRGRSTPKSNVETPTKKRFATVFPSAEKRRDMAGRLSDATGQASSSSEATSGANSPVEEATH